MPIYNSTEPSKIKYVQSMEIDYDGVMWILDVGRLNIADPATSTQGAAKLFLWDMNKNEQKGDEYVFPASSAPHNSSFLNDLMVDVPNQIAYISDAGSGAIVIVDMKKRVSARFHGASTKRDPAYKYVVEGWNYGNQTGMTPADGIALTPDRKWLSWCPCQGAQLWKVRTRYLKRLMYGEATAEEVRAEVVYVGLKRSNADGMAFATNGILYSGGNADPDNAVWAWDPNNSTSIQDKTNIAPVLWADTFAFDDDEHLLWTGNNLMAFFNNRMNFTNGDTNFIIYSQRIYAPSYMDAQRGGGSSCSDEANWGRAVECWYDGWPYIYYVTILPAAALALSICIASGLRSYHNRQVAAAKAASNAV
jgi:sugar lactone lactonase YvrE